MVLPAVSNAHASWMTAMSACSESPLNDQFGMSDVSCECGQTATWQTDLYFPFSQEGMATICLYTMSMAIRTVTIVASPSVFSKQ